MKKAGTSVFLFIAMILGSIGAAAQGTFPVTGQTISPVPYILLGVSIVLLIALAVLTYINKKKK